MKISDDKLHSLIREAEEKAKNHCDYSLVFALLELKQFRVVEKARNENHS